MEEIHIQCPYCLQAIPILLDTGIYEPATIVEDCEVCCNPIELTVKFRDNELIEFSAKSIEQ